LSGVLKNSSKTENS